MKSRDSLSAFERFERTLPEEQKARGDAFEHAVARLLRWEQAYANDVRHVYLWKDWPDRPNRDLGIDIVVETKDGELWAVQCKAVSEHGSLSKKDLDSFLADSSGTVSGHRFAQRLLFATTDKVSRNARIELGNHRARIRLRQSLIESEFGWQLSRKALRPKRRQPLPHQARAISKAVKDLESHDRVQIHMPCGTGKTLVGLRIAEKHSGLIVYCAPTLGLLQQTASSWLHDQRVPMHYLAVCSDFAKEELDETIRPEDLLVEHSSDVARLKQFIRGQGPRVILTTYASAPLVGGVLRSMRRKASILVADEAHRAVSGGHYSSVVRDSDLKVDKRVFLTATPRILRPQDKARSALLSMDDETMFGPVSYRMSFSEAIQKDLLADYDVYVIAAFDRQARDDVTLAKSVKTPSGVVPARQAATARAVIDLCAGKGATRVISFHNSIKSAKEMASHIDVNFRRGKKRAWSQVVSSEMNAQQRAVVLRRLSQNESSVGVVTNARCLSEGIDLPSLDAVVFADPKSSQTEIVQAVGRALRKSAKGTRGMVVVPFPVLAGQDAEEALSASDFDVVWRVIRALRAHDEVLAEELDAARTAMGSGASWSVPGKIRVVGLSSRVLAAFERAFTTRLIEETSDEWEEWFGALQSYAKQTGSARIKVSERVPIRGAARNLGRWADKQRARWRDSDILPERKAKLESLPGWAWNLNDAAFLDTLECLIAFEKKFHHASPGQDEVYMDRAIGRWVVKQRGIYRREKLSQDRIEALEAVPGWTWNPREDRFRRELGAMSAYVDLAGDISPRPGTVHDGVDLNDWSERTRNLRNTNRLSKEREALMQPLLEAGWSWAPRDDNLWHQIGVLNEVARERPDGLASVRQRDVISGHKVGQWMNVFRSHRASLRDEVREALEAIPGWTWDKHQASFDTGIRELEAFGRKHGHLRVPRTQPDFARLVHWKRNQKHRLGKQPNSTNAKRLAGLLKQYGESL